jgi:hypothetical protein
VSREFVIGPGKDSAKVSEFGDSLKSDGYAVSFTTFAAKAAVHCACFGLHAAVIRYPSGPRDDLRIIRLDLAIYSCPSRAKSAKGARRITKQMAPLRCFKESRVDRKRDRNRARF